MMMPQCIDHVLLDEGQRRTPVALAVAGVLKLRGVFSGPSTPVNPRIAPGVASGVAIAPCSHVDVFSMARLFQFNTV